ncbi:Aquaporin-8, partial [Ophiophagus hannah]
MTSEPDLRPHCHIPVSTSTHLIGLAGNVFAYQGIIFVFQNRPAMSDMEFGQMSFKEPELETKRGPAQPHWYERYLQPCIGELVGSAFFIYIGCVSVIENSDGTGRLQPALAHGLALGLTIAILGNISGGHYNPAVSLGAWLVGGLNMVMVIPYWVSQLCGGMIGAGLAKVTTMWERYENATGGAFTAITSDPQLPAAVVGEIVMTMLLVMAVCMGAINEKTKSPLAPFCIGLTVTGSRFWSLYESSQSFWPCSGCQPLGLPLGVLGGPHGGCASGGRIDKREIRSLKQPFLTSAAKEQNNGVTKTPTPAKAEGVPVNGLKQ